MTRGELLKMLTRCAADYYRDAAKSIKRNKHMNELDKKDWDKIKKEMPVLAQKIIEATIVDFVNFVGIWQGIDYGLKTKHLPEEFQKNKK